MDYVETRYHRYSTALSYIVLAGTSIYCLTRLNEKQIDLPHISYGTILLNSVIGIFRWGNPKFGEDAVGLHQLTTHAQICEAMPCIVTNLWFKYNYMLETGYGNLGFCILVFLLKREDLIDLLTLVNSATLGVISYVHQNYFGVAAAISYAFNHYCIRYEGAIGNVPALDIYNYGLCFFEYFALRSLTD